MYSSQRANEKYASFESTRFTAGIHENVLLTGIEKKTSPGGNNMIAFTFTMQDGNVLRQVEVSEWEPKGSQFQTIEDAADKNFKKIQQILLAYFPDKESLTFDGNSFNEFCDWVINTYNGVDKSTLLRLKLVYDKSGWLKIPNHGYYDQFIEAMSVSESKIKKIDKDIFEKPIIADTEKNNPNPITVVDGTLSATSDDLPF